LFIVKSAKKGGLTNGSYIHSTNSSFFHHNGQTSIVWPTEQQMLHYPASCFRRFATSYTTNVSVVTSDTVAN